MLECGNLLILSFFMAYLMRIGLCIGDEVDEGDHHHHHLEEEPQGRPIHSLLF